MKLWQNFVKIFCSLFGQQSFKIFLRFTEPQLIQTNLLVLHVLNHEILKSSLFENNFSRKSLPCSNIQKCIIRYCFLANKLPLPRRRVFIPTYFIAPLLRLQRFNPIKCGLFEVLSPVEQAFCLLAISLFFSIITLGK